MLACEGNTTLQDTRSPRSMRTRMQQYADTYAAVCAHVCSSMRTRMQEYADTYAGECGHVCRRMRTRMQEDADTYAGVCGHIHAHIQNTYAAECGWH